MLVPCDSTTIRTDFTELKFDEFVKNKSLASTPSHLLQPYQFLACGNLKLGYSPKLPYLIGDIGYKNPLYDFDGAVKVGKWLFVIEVKIRPDEDAIFFNKIGQLPPLDPSKRGVYHICAFHKNEGHHTFGKVPDLKTEDAPYFLLQWVLANIIPWLYEGHGLEVIKNDGSDNNKVVIFKDSVGRVDQLNDEMKDLSMAILFFDTPLVHSAELSSF